MTQPSPERWNDFAPTYLRQLWLERAAIRRLLSMLEVRSDESLLDVGTGTGALLAELARAPTRPSRAIGVDSAPAMLARAPSLPDGWPLEPADATALPFDDSSFDVVTAAYLLHVLDRDTCSCVIAEIARVLRPGGRIGTITIAPARGGLARALSAPLTRAAAHSRGRLAGLQPHDPSAQLAEAGFVSLRESRSWRGYPSLCIVAKWAP